MELYKPIPFRSGNTIIRKYQEPFVDPVGNKAVITKVDYKASKGKLITGYTLYVRWIK